MQGFLSACTSFVVLFALMVHGAKTFDPQHSLPGRCGRPRRERKAEFAVAEPEEQAAVVHVAASPPAAKSPPLSRAAALTQHAHAASRRADRAAERN